MLDNQVGAINGFMYKAWIKKKLPSGINYICGSLRLSQIAHVFISMEPFPTSYG